MVGRTIYDDLFGFMPSKSQQRMVEIAEATIKTYVKVGVDATTFERIAKAAKISRPLILHYFPDYQSLFDFVAKYIRATLQNYVISRVSTEITPEAQLKAYIDACFDWTDELAPHAKVWLLFYFFSATHPKFEAINTALVKMGVERIAVLLQAGKKSGVFKCVDPYECARTIQIHITGALASVLTEDRKFNAQLKSKTRALCLNFARGYP